MRPSLYNGDNCETRYYRRRRPVRVLHWTPSSSRAHAAVLIFHALLLLTFVVLPTANSSSFEPYELNGGLVAAVAGRGYVLLASDTRLSRGYEILTRNHLASRLWGVGGGGAEGLDLLTGELLEGDPDPDAGDDYDYDGDRDVEPPPADGVLCDDGTSSTGGATTLVGSAGCAADCDALRRQVQAEASAHVHWNGSSRLTASSVATMVGNVLYHRRGFPFYAFCVVAGLDVDGPASEGVVHVYDAIGSHERVAVAAAGSGKEMLQPVLDRLFSTSNLRGGGERRRPNAASGDDGAGRLGARDASMSLADEPGLPRDAGSVAASEQRVGMSLRPPVRTCVECNCDQAVALLVKGYRSVAEREISVGDEVFVCVLRPAGARPGAAGGGGGHRVEGETRDVSGTGLHQKATTATTLQVLRFPLKRH